MNWIVSAGQMGKGARETRKRVAVTSDGQLRVVSTAGKPGAQWRFTHDNGEAPQKQVWHDVLATLVAAK